MATYEIVTPASANLKLSDKEHQWMKAYVRWTLGLRSSYPNGSLEGLLDYQMERIANSVEFMLRGMPTRGGSGVG